MWLFCACRHISPSPFFSLMFRPFSSAPPAPSLLFPHGPPDWSCSLRHLLGRTPDLKSLVQRTPTSVRTCLATWPHPSTAQVMSPSSPTRWSLRTMTRRPSTIQTTTVSLRSPKPHSITLDGSVFLQCGKSSVSADFSRILLFRRKAKKA